MGYFPLANSNLWLWSRREEVQLLMDQAESVLGWNYDGYDDDVVDNHHHDDVDNNKNHHHHHHDHQLKRGKF